MNAGKLYGNVDVIEERHRHRYEVNPVYADRIEAAGMIFVGKKATKIMFCVNMSEMY